MHVTAVGYEDVWGDEDVQGTEHALTRNEIAQQPLQVVEADPRQEGKERAGVSGQVMAVGKRVVHPLDGRRFLFHVGVGGLDGEDALAATDLLVDLIAVLQLDAEALGQAVADLGGGHGVTRVGL
jgi:hypothetical protein